MTIPPKSSDYLKPYREAIERHGPGFAATLWRSPEAQVLRFEIMVELVSFDGMTLLDIGCGQGDMAAHLIERSINFQRYVGLDAVEEMIDLAGRRNLPRCEFHVLDVLRHLDALREYAADFICLSGTLNTMDEATAMSLVEHAYNAAAQGVVFNFLSDRAAPEWLEKDLWPARRFDTAKWIDRALAISPRVSFTQDYLDGHDATIVIRH